MRLVVGEGLVDDIISLTPILPVAWLLLVLSCDLSRDDLHFLWSIVSSIA